MNIDYLKKDGQNTSNSTKKIKNRKGIHSLAPYQFAYLVRFLNLKELLLMLKLHRKFTVIIKTSSIFKSYLQIREEFTEQDAMNSTLLLGKNNSQSQSKYYLRHNQLPVLTKHLPGNSKNKNNSKSKGKPQNANFAKYSLQELLQNNCHLIRQWMKKYKITPSDAVVIFSGLILSFFNKTFELKPTLQKRNFVYILKGIKFNSGLIYLSHALAHFPYFTKLDFSENQIDHNSIKSISLCLMFSRKTLSILNLSNNKIGDSGAKILFRSLEQNKMIQYLDLSGNDIGSEGIESSQVFLSNSTSIQTLNLENNLLGASGAVYLNKFLQENISLRALNISYNGIQAEGCQHLGELFTKNKKLLTLYMGGNYIFHEGIKSLTNGIIHHPALCYLFLEWNNITDLGAEHIAALITSNPYIYTVDLKNNLITDAGAESLSQAIAYKTRLASIDLSENKITDVGVKCICEALKTNQTIGGINLAWNSIKISGCKYLSEMLSINNSLKNLNISYCGIKEGAKLIFEALEKNKKLSIINLSGNVIGSVSNKFLSPLSNALKTNFCIKEISMDDCNLNDDDIEVICEGIQENRNLSVISLKRNHITNKKQSLIEYAIKTQGYIREVYLEDNLMGLESIEKILHAVKINQNISAIKAHLVSKAAKVIVKSNSLEYDKNHDK